MIDTNIKQTINLAWAKNVDRNKETFSELMRKLKTDSLLINRKTGIKRETEIANKKREWQREQGIAP